jgi:hypothetical protein
MKLRPIILACVLGVTSVVSACGDDGGPSEVDAPIGAIDAAPPDASQPDAQQGSICGGKSGTTCAATQYCDFATNGCGFADDTGICVDRPTDCPDPVFEATCGCDGTVYGQPCDAYAAGTDLNAYGTCPVPGESFACGWLQCDRLTEYCEHTQSGIPGGADSYACRAVPDCPSQFPNCACLASEPCGSTCAGDVSVGLTLTCQAP